jgi:hypothetical protein
MGREALPTHVRLFGDIFADDRSTLTEEDFSKEELDVMRNLVKASNYSDNYEVNRLLETRDEGRNVISMIMDDAIAKAKTPEIKKELEKQKEASLAQVDKDIDSYLSTADRTNVNYTEYMSQGYGNLNNMNAWDSIISNLSPSAGESVLNSLGRFSAQYNPDGSVDVEDYYAMDLTPESVIEEGSFNPRDIVEAIAYAANPSYHRKITVNLPDVDWEKPEVEDLNRTGLESTIK